MITKTLDHLCLQIEFVCSLDYCLTTNNELIIFNRLLRSEELLFGIFLNGNIVKQPLLVQQYDLTVRCAGDELIIKDSMNHMSGILASRASGHFKPDSIALEEIKDFGHRILGLTSDSTFLPG